MASSAHSVTLGFDGLAQSFSSGTFLEAGLTKTHVSGGAFGNDGAGNPGDALWVGCANAPSIGDTLSISLDGGGLFSFVGFDFRSNTSIQSDPIDFLGRVSGGQTEVYANVSSTSPTFIDDVDPLFGAAIDELLVVVSGAGTASLLIDNLELVPTAIPLPMTGVLLLNGLAVLAPLARRRRRDDAPVTPV